LKNPGQLNLLFEKHLSGSCTPEETQLLMDHFHLTEDQELLKELVTGALDHQDEGYFHNPVIADVVARVDTDLFDQIHSANKVILVKRLSLIRLWPRIAAAAVLLITIGAGLILYLNSRKLDADVSSAYVNDIAPGEFGATLTLANGKMIRLADAANGEVAKEAGISVTKTADGQLVYQVKERAGEMDKINTLSTAKGETYMLILPDKSKVWLNAASSLTYSAALIDDGKRVVKLQGEGYFEITRDKAHPFVVQTDKQKVEVLGTHFNVNAYADEPSTRTTLLEGSVKVSLWNSSARSSGEGDLFRAEDRINSQSVMLRPDQQALVSLNGVKVIPVVAESYVDWKDGAFNFRKEDLQSIMRKVSRWYNVEVIYETVTNPQQTYTGYVSRSDHVSKVLQTLSKISNLKFEIRDRKIRISK